MSLLETMLVRLRIKIHIILLAWKAYHNWQSAKKVLDALTRFKKAMYGKNGKRKLVKRDGEYWFSVYSPPFPSVSFDRFILTEFNRHLPHNLPVVALQQLTLAITSRCPMQCEHCFEWNNLSKTETFDSKQLQAIVSQFEKEGATQISLSGGEPMARWNDLLHLLENGDINTTFCMFTSGIGITGEKAIALKQAGLKAVIVSIDDFVAERHDKFRGRQGSFHQAVAALRHCRNAGLITAVSVCITRNNANNNFLNDYLMAAERWGADFVQLLEPKATGHYANKDVELTKREEKILEAFYLEMNFSKKRRKEIPIIYHGYHQRHAGCMMGGVRSLYVDSAGNMHSCPFCHSNNFKVSEWLKQPATSRQQVSPCAFYPLKA